VKKKPGPEKPEAFREGRALLKFDRPAVYFNQGILVEASMH